MRKITLHSKTVFAILISGLLILLSCSTKKNTFTRRAYHNLTSHYNIYWNGRESMKEGIENLNKKVKDNYTKVLPVYNFGNEKDAQSLNPQMDRALKKGSIAIQKHSMVFDGEEKVNWIDDCYMLIGQAYFFKQEYFSARRTFNFIIKEFGEEDIKYDAMLWLAQTYNVTEEYEKAEALLNLISVDVSEGKTKYEIESELPRLYADHYVRQERYDEAIDYLYESLAYHPPRDQKIRITFILAQIFQQNEDLARASDLYRQVIKKNPPYEMAFQAKINMARSFDATTGDKEQILKILTKMLKDSKNKEFLDQIYFALAEVALRANDKEGAIAYLKESVKYSTSNNYQKATSSLTLADLYFEIPDYENAQAYYDTAMMFIPKDYPNYRSINAKTNVLSELVVYLITISREDSLQRLASMTDNERNEIIDQIIVDYQEELERLKEEEELQKALEAANQGGELGQPNISQGMPIGGGKEWYFYNTSTKDFGYTQFIRKWGKRKLEDLWFLSNKQLSSFDLGETEITVSDSTLSDSLIAAANDPLQRDYYLKNLPFTEEEVIISDKKILDAYFELGKLYRDGLEDNTESRIAFERMNERFPGNNHELISYYYLYKIFDEIQDFAQREYYKNLIITRYPDSDYAKVLVDPEYFKKLAEKESKASKLYTDTYKAYESGQYYMVIARSDMALSAYGDTNELAPKFAFLRAISIGRVDILDSLVSALKDVVIKYPTSEVKNMATDILSIIIAQNPEFADETFQAPGQVTETPSIFKFSARSMHMFMIIVNSKEVRLNPLKVKISDYNKKYYSLDKLSINSLVLDNKNYLVTVGNFNNSEKALKYFRAITSDDYVYSDMDPEYYQNFVISTENYPTFFKEKNVGEYSTFFEKNYPMEE